MWKCPICDTEIDDDSWQECWKCSHRRGTTAEDVDDLRDCQTKKQSFQPNCIRCKTPSHYAGTKRFHEGSNLGFWLGDMGHLFQNHERYDVYYCPKCGKVEFFVDGIGDTERGEAP